MAVNDDLGEMVTDANRWLDGEIPNSYRVQSLAQDWQRIAKLTEEAGEVVLAFMNMTGANPRKGIIGSVDEVTDELADVATTAVLAIQHFTGDWSKTEEILWNKIITVWQRVPEGYRAT